MSMFDDLLCEYPLPDGYTGQTFQTKDLICYMEKYALRADGSLELFRFERVTDTKRGWPYFTRENERWEKVNHDGAIRMYDWDVDADVWYEYEATFADGTLTGIEAVARDW